MLSSDEPEIRKVSELECQGVQFRSSSQDVEDEVQQFEEKEFRLFQDEYSIPPPRL